MGDEERPGEGGPEDELGDGAGEPPTPTPPPEPGWERPDHRGFQAPRERDMARGEPVDLRPRTLGSFIRVAFRLFSLHWRSLIPVAAFVIVPFAILQQAVIRAVTSPFVVNGRVHLTHPDAVRALLIGLGFSVVSILLVQSFLTAALTRAVGDVYAGRDPTVGTTYRAALGRLLPVLLVVFVTAVLTALGFVALIVPGLYLLARFAFAPPVVVWEDLRGWAAIRRSWDLARGRTWRIFGTLFLFGIIVGVINGLLSIPSAIAASGTTSGWVIRAISTAITGSITAPLTAMMPVLLYFDMRVRKEGPEAVAATLARPA